MVDPISSTAALAATKPQSEADSSLSKFAEDFDNFLTLMVAQLKNQDPLEPLDSNQFTDQIVQFTGVEQSINTNKKLDNLVDIMSGSRGENLLSYVGKDVEAVGNFIELKQPPKNSDGSNILDSEGNIVREETSISYVLDERVDNAFVTIRDLNGTVLFSGEGPKTAGRNSVTWDGINNDSNYSSPGIYQVSVSVQNAEGNVEDIDAYVSGKVQGVNFDSDEPTLIINSEIISADAIRFIGERA